MLACQNGHEVVVQLKVLHLCAFIFVPEQNIELNVEDFGDANLIGV